VLYHGRDKTLFAGIVSGSRRYWSFCACIYSCRGASDPTLRFSAPIPLADPAGARKAWRQRWQWQRYRAREKIGCCL